MTYPKQVPAVERVLRLLEAIASSPNGLSAGELEASLQISRSTLFALLNTLKARNYIEQSEQRGAYRIGPAMYALLPVHHYGMNALLESFHNAPELQTIEETVALTRLDGEQTVVIAKREGRRQVRVVLDLGQRRAAVDAADGLVLLAGRPAPPDPGLAAILQEIRQQAYARSADDESISLAAPICADGYQPVAALLMMAPAFRGRPARTALQSLRQLAARLSYRMGAPLYFPYGHPPAESVEPTTAMESTEVQEFLASGRGARLACIRPDGAPHVVPLWYEWDGASVWIAADADANWKSYIRQNPWVSLTIDEPWPPLRRVLIVGRADPVSDGDIPGGVAGLRERLERRYLGRRQSPTETTPSLAWQAFRIRPQKIVGRRGLGKG